MPVSHTDPDNAGIADQAPGIQASLSENSPLSYTEPELNEFDENFNNLQAAKTQDTPDAHTDSESDVPLSGEMLENPLYGSDEVNSASSENASLHTGPELDEKHPGTIVPGPLQQDESPSLHTDLESDINNASQDEKMPILHTGSESDQSPPASSPDSPVPADNPPDSHTGSENEAKAAEGSIAKPKTPRRRAVKSQSGEDESKSTTPAPEPAPTTVRRRRARSEPVLAIDDERSVETQADKLKNDLLDLVESQKGRRILSGTIQGVERSADNPNISFAVIYHGAFKVIIPAEETVQPPEDFRDRSPADVMHYLVTKRLGAEIDYIVKGVDPASGIAAASRLEAMALKRRQYYFGSDRDGNNLIYEGLSAEARVVSVIRAGMFVDLFGLETYISLRELSYQRWIDAAAHFQPGQRVLVKIMELDRSNRDNIRVVASVKQAGENPYEQALKRYTPGSRYVGTVSLVDTNGVFVSLDGGIDCLCSYPKRGRPPRGARVTVRVIGVNHESNRIWGAITHMTTAR
jgi:predicted RNA-binding protein with RPS1 domain